MTLLIALLLAAAPAPDKPPHEGAELSRDCAAYLAIALGDNERRRVRDEFLQRDFEAWVQAFEAASGKDSANWSGAAVSDRSVALAAEPRKTRAARIAWCRANAPKEKSA